MFGHNGHSVLTVNLVFVSQLMQCGCVTGCSWQYEMFTDLPLCHMTQTLIYMSLLCVADIYVAYSRTVYELLISCSTDVNLEILRVWQQVEMRYKNLHWPSQMFSHSFTSNHVDRLR